MNVGGEDQMSPADMLAAMLKMVSVRGRFTGD